jgi:hypothetical protein
VYSFAGLLLQLRRFLCGIGLYSFSPASQLQMQQLLLLNPVPSVFEMNDQMYASLRYLQPVSDYYWLRLTLAIEEIALYQKRLYYCQITGLIVPVLLFVRSL